jgi:hypothetical protein
MSFKQNLAVFTVLLAVWSIVSVMALSWVTPALVADAFSVVIEYPPIAVALGGVVIAGLVGDYLGS